MYINVWMCECMQSLLTDAKVFINSLFTFDKDNIPDRIIKASLLHISEATYFLGASYLLYDCICTGHCALHGRPQLHSGSYREIFKGLYCDMYVGSCHVQGTFLCIHCNSNEKWINRMYHLCSITSSLLEWHPRELGWRKLRYDTACHALDDDK